MEQFAISFLVMDQGILRSDDPDALKRLGFAPGVRVVLATVPHRDLRLYTLVQSASSTAVQASSGGSSGLTAAKTPMERFRLKLTSS